jgi:hypothetical protein
VRARFGAGCSGSRRGSQPAAGLPFFISDASLPQEQQ